MFQPKCSCCNFVRGLSKWQFFLVSGKNVKHLAHLKGMAYLDNVQTGAIIFRLKASLNAPSLECMGGLLAPNSVFHTYIQKFFFSTILVHSGCQRQPLEERAICIWTLSYSILNYNNLISEGGSAAGDMSLMSQVKQILWLNCGKKKNSHLSVCLFVCLFVYWPFCIIYNTFVTLKITFVDTAFHLKVYTVFIIIIILYYFFSVNCAKLSYSTIPDFHIRWVS